MLKTILIDDEANSLDTLDRDLSKYCPEVQVLAKCHSGIEGIESIRQHKPHLVFLDVEMPCMNGFKMLEIFGEITFDVIFVTAYDQYALQAFRISAMDYLLKPVDKDDLQQAVKKVVNKKGNFFSTEQFDLLLQNLHPYNSFQRIALPAKDGLEFVHVHEIQYCEADGNFTKVFMQSGKKYYITRLLKDMEQALENFPFCRIHHAYLVNLDHVVHYTRGDGGSVKMVNGEEIPVSRAKKEELLSRVKW